MSRSFSRRDLLAAASAGVVASLLPGCASTRLSASSPPTRLIATLPKSGSVHGDVQTSFWPAAAIPNTGEGLLLTWSKAPAIDGQAHLRMTIAGAASGTYVIEVRPTGAENVIARVELQSPAALTIAELTLSPSYTQSAIKQGLDLRINGPAPLTLLLPDASSSGGPPLPLQPHLLVGSASDAVAELKNRLASLDTLQPFGLHEGCVTDAQWDLFRATGEERFRNALNLHFDLFTGAGGMLGLSSGQNLEASTNVDLLPIAALARHRPTHPILGRTADHLTKRRDEAGVIDDGGLTTTDAAYAVAYPLAVIAGVRKDPALTQLAIDQLKIRQRRLVGGNDLYRRLSENADLPDAAMGKNETRGMAWWLLGLVRTLAEVRPADRPPELTAELARSAAVARKTQLVTGLWPESLDQPTSLPDTAASAGIAAAIAIGTRQGLLPPDYFAVARKVYAGLRIYLTPDGYLAATVQTGVASQPSFGQVIQPWAIGLLGQLIAALQPGVERG